MQEEYEEIIVNDQSENGQKDVKQEFNTTHNFGCFVAHIGLWLVIIALGIAFFGRFISLCGAVGVYAWFKWIAIGVMSVSIVMECLKYLKTKQFNIKGDLLFIIVIAFIICTAL